MMSRALNSLMEKQDFKRFEMPRGSPKINHLGFANNIIILFKVDVRTMQMITNILEWY